jgi:endogenous inhibitor of DNA gyrase (YacG/DUF329 family)
MKHKSKYDCPKCHKKISGLQRNRFLKARFMIPLPVAAPCPHCGTKLTMPTEPWKKTWIGFAIFAIPGWIELIAFGGIKYAYAAFPISLWIIWSNQCHVKLILASSHAVDDVENQRRKSNRQKKKKR